MRRILTPSGDTTGSSAVEVSAHSTGVGLRFCGAGWRALLVAVAVAAAAGVAYCGGQRTSGQKDAATAAFALPQGQETARFSGLVVDAVGLPIANVGVAMCGSACWPAWTDADGRFVYEELPVARYALDVRGDAVAERRLTSVVFPVELVAGSQELPAPIRLQEAVSVPAWDGTRPVRFAGLSLVPSAPVDLDALQRAGGADIGGARVPPAAWPSYRLAVDEVPYRPIAMWALRPFGAQAGQRLAVRVAAPAEGIEPGAELAFFSVNLVTGAAEWVGPAVPADEEVRTAAGSGIETLTWIILAARQRS